MYVQASMPSKPQVQKLLKFLESNRWLTTRQARTAAARDRTKAAWQYISVQLNNVEGCKKSWQQWSKYWSDKKLMVKKKAIHISKRTKEDVMGSEIEMSRVDLRIYAIIKDDIERRNAIRLKVGQERGEKMYKIRDVDDTESETVFNPQLLPEMPIGEDPLPSTSELQGSEEENMPISPTRKKSRSRMEDLTERFLSIEEKRVEIEYTEAKSRESLAQSLAEMAKSWREQTTAIVSLAESVKIMVGKINTDYDS